MNTQYNFLDNAVNDESELTGMEDMDTKMCSYPPNDTEDVCSTSQDGTCGDGFSAFPSKTDYIVEVKGDLRLPKHDIPNLLSFCRKLV